MRKKQIIENIIGLTALLLSVALFFISGNHDKIFPSKVQSGGVSDESGNENISNGVISVPGDIIYEGVGKLDLMQGVSADDGTGRDATEDVVAVITADGTLNKKVIRYSFTDAKGEIVSEKRYLVMKKYKGPSLNVQDKLKLEASDLSDIINVLKNDGSLSASDGYGNDITENVTCIREKLYDNIYNITFDIVNAFGDGESVTVSAAVSGNVKDPELKLISDEIELKKGEIFDPLSVVSVASDGDGKNLELLKTEGLPDTEIPGEYRVKYTMYSKDRTSVARASVRVKVSGD